MVSCLACQVVAREKEREIERERERKREKRREREREREGKGGGRKRERGFLNVYGSNTGPKPDTRHAGRRELPSRGRHRLSRDHPAPHFL